LFDLVTIRQFHRWISIKWKTSVVYWF